MTRVRAETGSVNERADVIGRCVSDYGAALAKGAQPWRDVAKLIEAQERLAALITTVAAAAAEAAVHDPELLRVHARSKMTGWLLEEFSRLCEFTRSNRAREFSRCYGDDDPAVVGPEMSHITYGKSGLH